MGGVQSYQRLIDLTPSPSLDVPTLQALRLTSKAFYQAASRLLFHGVPAILKPLQLTDREMLINQHVHSFRRLGPRIKKLRLDFSSDEHGRSRHANPFLISENRSSNDPLTIRTDALICSVPSLLSQVSHLETFSVHLPAAQSTYGDSGGPDIVDNYSIPRLSATLHALSTAFQTSPLNRLSDLRLLLPCTHNFGQLSQALPSSLLSNLRALYLEITDASGPGGSKDYLWFSLLNNVDERLPSSNLQQQFPGADHAPAFFALVAKCTRLEVLCISGTRHLDLHLLAWTTTAPPPCLKVLFLNRVRVSAARLTALFSPTLTRLHIEEVSLLSGTWGEVFDHLRLRCPTLSYLNLCNLTYDKRGSSKDLGGWWGSAWQDCADLWSVHWPDEGALRALVGVLVGRPRGSDRYHSEWMELDGRAGFTRRPGLEGT